MIQSMTGFATKNFTLNTISDTKSNVTISIKTFNSRFFEATCRLPYQLSNLETECTQRMKKKLLRGHAYLTIQMDNPNLFKGNVQPALNVAQGYMNAIEQIKKACNITDPIELNHLLKIPAIFSIEEHGIDEQTAQTILMHCDTLIDQIIMARQQEGLDLKQDIIKRISIMEKEIEPIESLSKNMIEIQKAKVNDIMQELQGDANSLADMRKNTLYAFLDKIDIHEEIVRFKSHAHNLKMQLESPDIEKGKRLDFTLQELARETNTITAKCSDAGISSHAINIKVEIEKAREQVQNIV